MNDRPIKAVPASREFYPSLAHPYYFIRKGIFKAMTKYGGRLSGKMMDFGCGSKPYRDMFNPAEYVGVDYMNEGHSHENEQIDVYYDGKTIPIADNTFDSVLSSEVFEHIFNLPDILKEIHRVMKKDGLLLATCPFVWKEHETPNDYARYTTFALEDMLKKAGFEKVVIDKTGNFMEVLFQLYVLFFYDKFYAKLRRIPVVRELFTFFFIIMPNITGSLLSRFSNKSKQMYLNNVIIFKKC